MSSFFKSCNVTIYESNVARARRDTDFSVLLFNSFIFYLFYKTNETQMQCVFGVGLHSFGTFLFS